MGGAGQKGRAVAAVETPPRPQEDGRTPAFSVVIPLYEKAREIGATIASVRAQTCTDWELVVVDDGSTDGGPELVAAIPDARIRLLRQRNAGASAARNAGIRAARAEHVAFLDADDLWDPDYLETLAGLIRRHPGMGAYATAYRVREPDGRVRPIRLAGLDAPEGPMPEYFLSASAGEQPLHTSSTCVPRGLALALGGFREDARLGEDLDLWARIALAWPIAYHREAKSTYALDAGNRAMLRTAWDADWVFAPVAEEALAQGRVPEDRAPHLREHLAKVRLEIVRLLLCARDQRTARPLARALWAKARTRLFRARRLVLGILLLLPPAAARLFFSLRARGAGRTRAEG